MATSMSVAPARTPTPAASVDIDLMAKCCIREYLDVLITSWHERLKFRTAALSFNYYSVPGMRERVEACLKSFYSRGNLKLGVAATV